MRVISGTAHVIQASSSHVTRRLLLHVTGAHVTRAAWCEGRGPAAVAAAHTGRDTETRGDTQRHRERHGETYTRGDTETETQRHTGTRGDRDTGTETHPDTGTHRHPGQRYPETDGDRHSRPDSSSCVRRGHAQGKCGSGAGTETPGERSELRGELRGELLTRRGPE
ncbi:unnamed protein product [Lampetra fluviatilis]